jgi:pimeloyl-ACP methyl ester carboxylesterase
VVRATLLILGGLACAAIIAAGVWAWAPDRPRDQLERKYWESATRYLEIGGTSLRVRITGPHDAPAVLLIHGFGSSLETWEPWAQRLSAGYRVVRFDLPGCGLSEADRTGSYGDARSLDLIKALMDRLGIKSAVLVGNSMGGRIAWRFAAAFPERTRKLVLISPDGFASPGFQYGESPKVPVVLNLMKYFLPRALLRSNLAAAYGDPSRLGDSTVDRYYDLLLAPGNREAMIQRMQQSVLSDPIPLLRQIRAPTLLLWGKKDRLIPFSNSADYLSAVVNARLVAFEDLGHVPHEEAPQTSLPALMQFIAIEANAGSAGPAMP